MADGDSGSKRTARKCAEISRILVREELKARVKQVSDILKKDEASRTAGEQSILDQSPDVIKEVQRRSKHRGLLKQRRLEVEDEPDEFMNKCHLLATAIKQAKSLVVYTGAGISTAASIPDYRGPNGVWTLLEKGIAPKAQDLSDAEPTLTHMSIRKLQEEGLVEHVVSQNCDGLHLRSGLPRRSLSEVHGNMYIEVCIECSPRREYIRLFDVTENTGVRKHRTGRNCHKCKCELRDTIVHFGEKGGMQSPQNWEEAAEAAQEADTILCLGSTLKVLKRYPCLWGLERVKHQRPKLYIVNLQWTPKDESATLKINGKCDEVMRKVMEELGIIIPAYSRKEDPIFKLSTALRQRELKTMNKKVLEHPTEPQTTPKTVNTNTAKKEPGSNTPKQEPVLNTTKQEPGSNAAKQEPVSQSLEQSGKPMQTSAAAQCPLLAAHITSPVHTGGILLKSEPISGAGGVASSSNTLRMSEISPWTVSALLGGKSLSQASSSSIKEEQCGSAASKSSSSQGRFLSDGTDVKPAIVQASSLSNATFGLPVSHPIPYVDLTHTKPTSHLRSQDYADLRNTSGTNLVSAQSIVLEQTKAIESQESPVSGSLLQDEAIAAKGLIKEERKGSESPSKKYTAIKTLLDRPAGLETMMGLQPSFRFDQVTSYEWQQQASGFVNQNPSPAPILAMHNYAIPQEDSPVDFSKEDLSQEGGEEDWSVDHSYSKKDTVDAQSIEDKVSDDSQVKVIAENREKMDEGGRVVDDLEMLSGSDSQSSGQDSESRSDDQASSKRPVVSMPGWFGKGFNFKKNKRKRLT